MYDIKEINGENFLIELCRKTQKKYAIEAENKEEVLEWQQKTKAALIEMLGINRLVSDDAPAELVGSVKLDGYRRDKYVIPTAEKLKMPFYVLVPDKCNGKVVIALHGHGTYGKEGIAGLLPEEIKYDEGKHRKFAVDLAERGYIAVCPDLFGSGERISGFSDNKAKSICDLLNNSLISLGYSLQAVICFELMKLTRFALTLKENKFDKAASCGFSGGGLFSLWLVAICDDIDMGIVSGYFHTLKDTCLQSNKCSCNFVPDLWASIDCGELAALAAPKPLYIEGGNKDNLNGKSGLDSVFAQHNAARGAYYYLGCADDLQLVICDGAHQWYGSGFDFLDEHYNKNTEEK